MYDEDHAPVTLSEIHNQAESCQQTYRARTDQIIIFLAEAERPHLETLLNATGARVFGFDSLQYSICKSQEQRFISWLYARIGQLWAYGRAAARNLNPDKPRHLVRTVLLNV
jgi:glucosamine 6-phosphate synthetase-like amidotransferase/phosphosugar isomerase protein